jgi:hypothetical protein
MKYLPTFTSGFGVATAVALAAACADEPTAAREDPAAQLRSIASAAERRAVGAGVADATRRILPSLASLERFTNEADLGAQLEAIATALDRDDAAALERSVQRAERMLAKLASKDGGAGASELDAIRIMVADAKSLLSGTDLSTGDEATIQTGGKP